MSDMIVQSGGFSSLMEQADVLVKSGFLPNHIKSKEQAAAIMTMGQELQIGPWAAINGINVIQGKPTISPQLMLGLINRSGELEDMQIDSPETIATNEACSVTMKRKGRETPHTETFSMNLAKSMGLAGRDNWKKQAVVMLKWRAVAACARIVFPDVIIGFYTHEEIDPDLVVDGETGEILDSPPIRVITELSGVDPDDPAIAANHPPRPWTAEYLRSYYQTRVGESKLMGEITDGQMTKLAICFGELGEFTDNDRYTIMSYMAGRKLESSKGLNKAEASVMIEYFEKTSDETVKKELNAVLNADAKDKGQLDLPIPDEVVEIRPGESLDDVFGDDDKPKNGKAKKAKDDGLWTDAQRKTLSMQINALPNADEFYVWASAKDMDELVDKFKPSEVAVKITAFKKAAA